MIQNANHWRIVTNKLLDTENKYGCIPSIPDPRDFQYAVFASTQPLPPAFSRKDELPSVRNQGSLGTCVGYAAWAMKEWQELQQKDDPVGGLSPRFIYQMAKQLDEKPNVAGTQPRVALKVLQDYGTCPESVFPYADLTSDVNLPKPPDTVIQVASPYKINTYARIQTLDELKRAIVEQGIALLAVIVSDSFVNTAKSPANGEVYIPKPLGAILGGHAIVGVAYDDNIKLGDYTGGVLLMNSWGKSWADNGFAWLPYEAFTNYWIDADLKIPFIMEMWSSVDMPYTLKSAKQITLRVNNQTAYVDGAATTLDVPAQLINNRVLVPIRFLAENMGYIVNWEQGTKVVELRKPN